MEDKEMKNIKTKVYCKYCCEEVPSGRFCCDNCFRLFEIPKPVHGVRMIEEN